MPARKPRAVKLLRGTLRKDREPATPATPRAGTARAPTWLPPMERAAFRQLAAETARTGTPTRSFRHVLTGASIACAQLERCTTALAEKGDTYETKTTTGALKILPRPEVQLRAGALRLLKTYLVELGLTPAAIGRVDRAALPTEEDGTNAFAFLSGDRLARRQRFFGR
jgi:P27 family predicted phage terminase small subunit